MEILLFGRILGGLSTSLLFSAFESWMVSEHRSSLTLSGDTTHSSCRKRGFPEEWLATTFSISSWGNGIVAIIAGLFAQIATGTLSFARSQLVTFSCGQIFLETLGPSNWLFS
jgi:MFS transporter, MFS domain-containing protein family, molybdate-anion transporter